MSASTLLTGVPPAVRGHVKLMNIYRKTRQLLQKTPKDSAYRINTEAIICHRMAIVEEAGSDIKEIEENMSCGTIEMLIRQAENEFQLVRKMLLAKPWEPLIEQPPPGQWDWPPAPV